VCPACVQSTPALRFCGHCVVLLKRSELEGRAKAYYAAVRLRLQEMSLTARTISTEKRHVSIWNSFSEFMEKKMRQAALQASPLDVIAWLLSLDERAKTVVHTSMCAAQGRAHMACTERCPKRMKHSTIDSHVGTLRACFNERGLIGDYDNHRGTGNPCASHQLKEYVNKSLREQLAAGVTKRQAPCFGRDIYDAIIDHVLSAAGAAEQAKDFTEMYNALRDALILALLFHSLDRGADILPLTWSQLSTDDFIASSNNFKPSGAAVDQLPAPATINIFCGITKTGGRTNTRRTVSVPDDDSPASVPKLLAAFKTLITHHELDYGRMNGPMFRQLGSSPVAPISRSVVTRRLDDALVAINQDDKGFTLHSFRASGAIAAMLSGVPKEVVFANANWSSPDMGDYYTSMRQIHCIAMPA
jgi:hypothetical protein